MVLGSASLAPVSVCYRGTSSLEKKFVGTDIGHATTLILGYGAFCSCCLMFVRGGVNGGIGTRMKRRVVDGGFLGWFYELLVMLHLWGVGGV